MARSRSGRRAPRRCTGEQQLVCRAEPDCRHSRCRTVCQTDSGRRPAACSRRSVTLNSFDLPGCTSKWEHVALVRVERQSRSRDRATPERTDCRRDPRVQPSGNLVAIVDVPVVVDDLVLEVPPDGAPIAGFTSQRSRELNREAVREVETDEHPLTDGFQQCGSNGAVREGSCAVIDNCSLASRHVERGSPNRVGTALRHRVGAPVDHDEDVEQRHLRCLTLVARLAVDCQRRRRSTCPQIESTDRHRGDMVRPARRRGTREIATRRLCGARRCEVTPDGLPVGTDSLIPTSTASAPVNMARREPAPDRERIVERHSAPVWRCLSPKSPSPTT